MKIIKMPKVKPATCPRCGCVFVADEEDDLRKVKLNTYSEDVFVECPFCTKIVIVEFECADEQQSDKIASYHNERTMNNDEKDSDERR